MAGSRAAMGTERHLYSLSTRCSGCCRCARRVLSRSGAQVCSGMVVLFGGHPLVHAAFGFLAGDVLDAGQDRRGQTGESWRHDEHRESDPRGLPLDQLLPGRPRWQPGHRVLPDSLRCRGREPQRPPRRPTGARRAENRRLDLPTGHADTQRGRAGPRRRLGTHQRRALLPRRGRRGETGPRTRRQARNGPRNLRHWRPLWPGDGSLRPPRAIAA